MPTVFCHTGLAIIQTIAVAEDKQSEVSRKKMDISSIKWQVVGADINAEKVIDGNSYATDI